MALLAYIVWRLERDGLAIDGRYVRRVHPSVLARRPHDGILAHTALRNRKGDVQVLGMSVPSLYPWLTTLSLAHTADA